MEEQQAFTLKQNTMLSRAINSNKKGDNIRTPAEAAAYVNGLKFHNGTALGTQ